MKPRQQHRYGQALLEFALAAPILLFLVMGILDFGRVIFAYAMASNSIRSALRNAEVLGYSATATYLDTDTMNKTVRSVFFVNGQTVTIRYLKADGTYAEITKCEWDNSGVLVTACNVGDADLVNGDLLQIQSEVTINFITPLVNRFLPGLTLDFAGQRTIVKNIGLSGGEEANDTDYDGLDDDWEKRWFGDLSKTGTDDPDGDGCNNGCEEARKTFPTDADSDDEGLNDGDEVYNHGTDPLKWDTDDDGLNDKDEIVTWHTDPWDEDSDDDYTPGVGRMLKDGEDLPSGDGNLWDTEPLDPDSDDDGVLDGDEAAANTDPNKTDTDDDGLTDYDELVTYHTNALWWDSDNDNLSDKREVDPSMLTDPWDPDTDDDDLMDGDDLRETNPSDDTNDWDTNPHLADSDMDSLTPDEGVGPLLDGQEATGCTRPDKFDTDMDGLTDAQERYIYHTNACAGGQDTDADGASDGDEVNRYHTDPLNPNPPSDFEEIDVTDSDLDKLLDSWENTFFGNLDQGAEDDPDADGCDNYCEQHWSTNPTDPDTDHDRLSDYDEIFKKYPTDPFNSDTDGDRLPDGDEALDYLTKPDDLDTDDDLLTDYEEVKTYKTDPWKTDTDGDGLSDYDEVKTHKTDPLKADTDGDGLRDGDEITLYTSNPLDMDTDRDTLQDGAEVSTHHTSPIKPDTDGDGLSDGDEVNQYKTDPNKVDTDQDALSDYDEVMTHKTDPLKTDTDGDGLGDGDEILRYMTKPFTPDTDNDGLLDGDEIFAHHTNPLAPDTDGEKLKDGDEVRYSCNPTQTDTDLDALDDYQEVYIYHTDCSKADSDGDGVSDGDELANDTLPMNPIGISINNITVTEPKNAQSPKAIFTVTLDAPSVEVTTVNFSTSDDTAKSGDVVDSRGKVITTKDFVSNRGYVTFAPGETVKQIEISLVSDNDKDPNKQFFVDLMDPINAYLVNDRGICTILDND